MVNVENQDQLDKSMFFHSALIRMILIIFNIAFIYGLTQPWLKMISLQTNGEDSLVFMYDLQVTSIEPMLYIIPTIIIFISLITLFRKDLIKNSNVILFFLAIVLFLSMTIIMYDLGDRWIDSWASRPTELRIWEISFENGIWISTISAFIMIWISLSAIFIEKQNLNFLNWSNQKKLFVLLILINLCILHPWFPTTNFSILITIIILISIIITTNHYKLRMGIIWIFTILLFLSFIIQYFNYEYAFLITSTLIYLGLIGILVWCKLRDINMLQLKIKKEPEISRRIYLDPEQSLIDKKIGKASEIKPDFIQERKEKITKIRDITKSLKELKPPIINKGDTIKHYIELFDINDERASNLFDAGYTSLKEFNDAIPEDLIMIDGINPTLARKIVEKTKVINIPFS
jgi:hypothetical protein